MATDRIVCPECDESMDAVVLGVHTALRHTTTQPIYVERAAADAAPKPKRSKK